MAYAHKLIAYEAWMAEHRPEHPAGQCVHLTLQMVEAFPELKRERGHYVIGLARHGHFWCVDERGRIHDPTAEQFAPGGTYEPFNGPDPLGKCYECGQYFWASDADDKTLFCSLLCQHAAVDDLTERDISRIRPQN